MYDTNVAIKHCSCTCTAKDNKTTYASQNTQISGLVFNLDHNSNTQSHSLHETASCWQLHFTENNTTNQNCRAARAAINKDNTADIRVIKTFYYCAFTFSTTSAQLAASLAFRS
jgi:hypothetical protein